MLVPHNNNVDDNVGDKVDELLASMAKQITSRFSILDDSILMIGIHTGGVWVAERLHQLLGIKQTVGILDISFYRDDFSRIGMNPEVKPSRLLTNVDDKQIILVDDVLHTGRTIRAAMNEIFDYGRPASIALAVLVDRSGRELPVQADIVGKHISLDANEHVKLVGPDNLHLTVVQS